MKWFFPNNKKTNHITTQQDNPHPKLFVLRVISLPPENLKEATRKLIEIFPNVMQIYGVNANSQDLSEAIMDAKFEAQQSVKLDEAVIKYDHLLNWLLIKIITLYNRPVA